MQARILEGASCVARSDSGDRGHHHLALSTVRRCAAYDRWARTDVTVEFRFPDTIESATEPTSTGNWQFTFSSLAGFESRRTEEGKILHEAARLEGKRWIVPAEVELFTERGKRCVMLAQRDATEVTSFLLPLPRRPGKEYEEWSQWLPLQQAMVRRGRAVKRPVASEYKRVDDAISNE